MIKKISSFILIIFILFGFYGCKKAPDLTEINPRNDVYYQLFVRSFSDSDGDGVGDFNGITKKLDYLVDLGITGIWLMPIHPSPTYHGYDVLDYYDVNPDYGSLEDFKNLCKEAKAKGITIMIDLVVNHTSSLHEWFLKALAGDKKYKDYYVFTDQTTTGKLGSWGQNIWHSANNQKYCGYFSNTMPDLNFFNEAVIEEIYNIGQFWIENGVGGFRLDAAQHFFGTNEYLNHNIDFYDNILFLKDFRKKMREYDPNVYITGEINLLTESIVKEYFIGLDSPLDFPIANKVVTVGASNGNLNYAKSLVKIYKSYASLDRNFVSAPFLRNHDENRLATEYDGNIDKLKLVAEMLMVLPGSPIVYYGEEIGMYGSKSNGELSNGIAIWDETRRLPFNFGDEYTTTWFQDENFYDVIRNKTIKPVSEQLLDQESLLNTYRAIIKLRNENVALRYGNSITAYENNTSQVQGFYREYQYEDIYQKVLVFHNLSLTEQTLPAVNGNIIYASGREDLTEITTIAPKSTIVIDVSDKNHD
jgi:glycosidase